MHNTDETQIDAPPRLVRWLASEINIANFLETPSWSVMDLRRALQRGAREIVENLDSILKSWMAVAPEPKYCMRIDEEEMFAGRPIDWGSLCPREIDEWDGARVKEYLVHARREIAWVRNEIGRLKLHLDNASSLKTWGQRINFQYHPSRRETEHEDQD